MHAKKKRGMARSLVLILTNLIHILWYKNSQFDNSWNENIYLLEGGQQDW